MKPTLESAADRVLLGEAIASIARSYREDLLREMGLGEDDVEPHTFAAETMRFSNRLCRHLSERHGQDARVAYALRQWVGQVDEYDAYDSLLATFRQFEGRAAVLRRGKVRFPRALTAHWED